MKWTIITLYADQRVKFSREVGILNLIKNSLRNTNYTGQQNIYPLNLTMDSSRILYADFHTISRFFTPRQSFEILSAKITNKAILTLFRVPLNIKHQYLKSKYFVDVPNRKQLPLWFSNYHLIVAQLELE